MYKLAVTLFTWMLVALTPLTCVLGSPTAIVERQQSNQSIAFGVPGTDFFPGCKGSCKSLNSLLKGCSPGIGSCACNPKVPAAAQSCWDCLGRQKQATNAFNQAVNEVIGDFNQFCKSQNMEYATPIKNISLIATGTNTTINGNDNGGKNDAVELKAFGVVGLVVPAVLALSTLVDLGF
ncbi:hypothetical protein M422DRAFT_23452 [Sphaerobolus stellatus SS14]|nr:hypothetical protein M422DRAFT_23452 [Sphaerobolus stellatus SS14]